MPAALQKPLSSSRPEMVAAHVPLALHATELELPELKATLVVAAARSSRRLSRGAAILCVSCGVILIENGVRVHAAPFPCPPAATWVSEPAKGREHRD